MSKFITSSIGKKVIMSLSGLFLMVFLVVHLTVNCFLFAGADAFNTAANFMVTNPIIKVVEPILALGFIIHIAWSIVITIQNMRARPVGYNKLNQGKNSTFASRNMFVLGGLVLSFLAIHIANFYVKIKFTHEVGEAIVDGVAMHDTYTLVTSLFTVWWYVVIYVIGAIFLGFHLSHGFWSAFQTIGFSNDIWRKRLNNIGRAYAVIVAGGFALIPVYFHFVQ
ncbi:MAG: succinate dehydrogenase cytochrome b subunit [Bacteroidales bacterium]|nr:succinate dehydrogenase cytochrome b subunit [Bacteroidales bacterium]